MEVRPWTNSWCFTRLKELNEEWKKKSEILKSCILAHLCTPGQTLCRVGSLVKLSVLGKFLKIVDVLLKRGGGSDRALSLKHFKVHFNQVNEKEKNILLVQQVP